MTVHPEIIDGRPGTLVIESFVVDVPEGNTKDETCYFVQALIRCNLKSLADVSERMAVQDRTEPINQFWWEHYGVHDMMVLDSQNLFRDFLGRSFEHHASCAFPSCGDPLLFLPAFVSVCFRFQHCALSIHLVPKYRFFRQSFHEFQGSQCFCFYSFFPSLFPFRCVVLCYILYMYL